MVKTAQNQGVEAARKKLRARPKKEPKPKKKVEETPPPKEQKVWDKASIQELLAKNNVAVCRAVVAIHKRQTPGEQTTKHTKELNNRGYNKKDAELMSAYAEWFTEKGYLSESRLRVARSRIMKYWRQLLEIAEQKNGGDNG